MASYFLFIILFLNFSSTLPCFVSVCFNSGLSFCWNGCFTHLFTSLSPLSFPIPFPFPTPPHHHPQKKTSCIPRNSSTKLSARSWTTLSTTWLQCNSCTLFACASASPSFHSLSALLHLYSIAPSLWLCDLVLLIHQLYLIFFNTFCYLCNSARSMAAVTAPLEK